MSINTPSSTAKPSAIYLASTLAAASETVKLSEGALSGCTSATSSSAKTSLIPGFTITVACASAKGTEK